MIFIKNHQNCCKNCQNYYLELSKFGIRICQNCHLGLSRSSLEIIEIMVRDIKIVIRDQNYCQGLETWS